MKLFDSFVLDSVWRTGDGYLAAYANVARTGVQVYKGKELGRPELDTVRVYRPPSEVFHRDAMKSMAHRPVTLTHPSVTVNSRNWKKFAKGHTGDEVIRDGDHIRVPMVIMDAATIAAVEDGSARELSMGYSTDLKWKSGKTPAGDTYDAVQTAIRANHLAIVPVARGGDTLKIGDDKDEHGYGSYPRSTAVRARANPTPGTKSYRRSVVSAAKDVDQLSTRGMGLKEAVAKKSEDYGVHPEHVHEEVRVSNNLTKEEYQKYLNESPDAKDAQVDMTDDNIDMEDDSKCPKCGMDVDEDATVCPYCQEDLTQDADVSDDKDEHGYGSYKRGEGPGSGKGDYKTKVGSYSLAQGEVGKPIGEPTVASHPTAKAAMQHLSEQIKKSAGSGVGKGGTYHVVMPGGREMPLSGAYKETFGEEPKQARGGGYSYPRLRDSASLPDDWVKSTKDAAPRSTDRGERRMNAIVVVDGAQIEVADELSATVIKKHIANLSAQLSDTKADAAKAKADKEEADEEDERMQKDAKLKLDAAAGEIVALKQQLADAQALNSPEKLDALVKDRLAVTDSAMKLLPNTFSFDGKSVADIRKAAVSAKLGDATKDMSDAAIEGAFKALTVAAANSGTARLADSISRSHQNGGGGQVDVRDAALAEREAYLKDAWRTPAKQ